MSKTLLTGVKPTHIPHWGNYLGAIRPGVQLMKDFDRSVLFIADSHALTTVQNAKDMKEYTYQVAATWIACGVDPKKSIVYKQSAVLEDFELSWILSCVTPKGFMNRAHAYKARVHENEAAGKTGDDVDAGISMGLYSYPVLMSADILLFDTNVVPVGEDQVQHVEFARDMAQKFNRTFNTEALVLPKAHVQLKKNIPGLDGRKMSKSYGNHIQLFQDEKSLRKQIMKITTDSTPPEVPKDPATSLIFDLYKEFATEAQIADLDARYRRGIGWGEAKQALFEAVLEHFKEKTDTFNRLLADKGELDRIMADG
ncbi:MAG: tryptophan--tRNA ligase, partial [Bdellovibrionota bacterium]